MNPSVLFKDIRVLDCSPEAFAKARGMPVCDSREVEDGCVFTCIKGSGEDGHEHIREAVQKGAAVIVTEREVSFRGAEYVRVDDSRAAFAKMCSAACGRPGDSLHLIGVTGTNGKSSVVGILSHILKCSGENAADIGTITHGMTTPSPEKLYPELARFVREGVRYAAMEASSHALDQKRLAPLHFDVGAYTNLTPEHLDYHGSMEAYAAVKEKLFDQCSLGVFCADSKEARETARRTGRKKYLYGMEKGDIYARNVRYGWDGSEFELCFPTGSVNVELSLTGTFQVSNAVAAASCAYLLGADMRDIATALKSVKPISGRLERADDGTLGFRVYIDYAHTPDAIENAMLSLRTCMKENERLCVIFGCGGDRDKTKRPKIGSAVSRIADFAIVTSDNPRSEDPYEIIRQTVSKWDGDAGRLVICDRRQAVKYAVDTAREGDVLLFCGKGHENYTEDASGKHEYNERQVVRDELARLMKE